MSFTGNTKVEENQEDLHWNDGYKSDEHKK